MASLIAVNMGFLWRRAASIIWYRATEIFISFIWCDCTRSSIAVDVVNVLNEIQSRVDYEAQVAH